MDPRKRWRSGFGQSSLVTVVVSWSRKWGRGDRRAAQRLVGLVADLQTVGPGDTLRNALRVSLGDPGLDIAYIRVGSGGWIDERGQSMTAPVTIDGRAVTPIDRGGKPIAALIHDPSLLRSPGRLKAAVDAAALAFENEQQRADLRAEVADLRASHARILEAVDLERRRTERNLHDGAQQRLVGVALMLRLAGNRSAADAALAAILTNAAGELDGAIAELRELARGMHPAIFAATGLLGALESLAERPGLPVELRVDVPAPLPNLVEVAAYYVVAEALANATKHADATHAVVHATLTAQGLRVAVTDDGRGGATTAPGSGLEGLSDRVSALGGRLEIDSRTGEGTTISACLPLAERVVAARDPYSLTALRWVGWEMYELPAESYDQLTHEDQRSWVRAMFAAAGGVSHITPRQREWAVGFEAAAGAAPWVLEDLRTYAVDETIETTLALPGMASGGRGVLYCTLRMCTADGDLTADELGRITRTADDLGLSSLLPDLRRMVDQERMLQDQRFEMLVAPALADVPSGPR
ncbi:histidine kinase [Nocardioides sp. WS12]|uniref:histidine kinase n=1 Tax=Nocardioides sp. WS12 TaxID=2486272 RepID=UPI0015FB5A73|nr:histidine kinase [Nocardioides sp. WS12]